MIFACSEFNNFTEMIKPARYTNGNIMYNRGIENSCKNFGVGSFQKGVKMVKNSNKLEKDMDTEQDYC